MNRWRRRLGELHSEQGACALAIPHPVQNVQNVQNPPPDPASEHFEQIEQHMVVAAAPFEAAMAPCWGQVEEKCAAIVEHDGNIPRSWAQGLARLDPDRPPADVPPARWLRFIEDGRLFLEGPFCAIAAALGWDSHDLFGCDPVRPFARIDQAGLLWLLNGDRLIALTGGTATIEMPTLVRQTFRRARNADNRVLAWELDR